MRILITNCALRGRSGTEIVTMEMAVGLQRRGHEIAILSPLLGPSADQMRLAGIFVTDTVEQIPWTPHVIHGHHNHVFAAALCWFPSTPALFVCHSSQFWFDGPFLIDRVKRVFAVDEACRDRLIKGAVGNKGAVELLLNAIDLDCFLPRCPLPLVPRRALVLTKNVGHIDLIRQAAFSTSLQLDEINVATGPAIENLSDCLTQYDIVFATARMALEALAVGCAVVVVDGRGLAGMVTSSNVDRWRRNNFGIRLLDETPTVASLIREISLYDPVDAANVARHIRKIASLSEYLDKVEEAHTQIAGQGSATAADLAQIGIFISMWLRRLGEGIIPENFDSLIAANEFSRIHEAVVKRKQSAQSGAFRDERRS
ncbi:glycosyltransferase involved in cell wall biosynthesis [Nitrobacteraceae bacterium AZCC 2161]